MSASREMAAQQLLLQLGEACQYSARMAAWCAARAEADPAFVEYLLRRAEQYRQAVSDIESLLGDALSPIVRHPAAINGAVEAAWEMAESDTLTVFRDVFDSGLPSPIADTVRHHFQTGLAEMQRWQALQSRAAA